MYDYRTAIKDDVKRFFEDDDGYRFDLDTYRKLPRDEREEAMINDIYGMVYDSDAVTGENCGYASEDECRDMVMDGNLFLAYEAVTTQANAELWKTMCQEQDYVGMDCNIRGYLLWECIAEVVEEICDEMDKQEQPKENTVENVCDLLRRMAQDEYAMAEAFENSGRKDAANDARERARTYDRAFWMLTDEKYYKAFAEMYPKKGE